MKRQQIAFLKVGDASWQWELTLNLGTDAAAQSDSVNPLNYGLLPGLNGGLGLPLLHREKEFVRPRKGRWGVKQREEGEVVFFCAQHRFMCEFTVAMSHTVWELECICAQHTKCVPLDSISSLQPHSIWCQLCTVWYRACSALQGDEWDEMNSATVSFINVVTCKPWVQEIHSDHSIA